MGTSHPGDRGSDSGAWGWAVIEARRAVAKVIVQLIRSLLEGIAELDRKIEKVAPEHPDFLHFDSLPGAGPVMASRLLAALWLKTDRYSCAHECRCTVGSRQ